MECLKRGEDVSNNEGGELLNHQDDEQRDQNVLRSSGKKRLVVKRQA